MWDSTDLELFHPPGKSSPRLVVVTMGSWDLCPDLVLGDWEGRREIKGEEAEE